MYKNVLQSIDNIAIWPLISFGIFFIFFLLLLWWVFTVDKKFITKMENLPFSDSSTDEAKSSLSNSKV